MWVEGNTDRAFVREGNSLAESLLFQVVVLFLCMYTEYVRGDGRIYFLDKICSGLHLGCHPAVS